MQSKKTYTLFVLVCTIFGSTFLAISLGIQAGASPLFYAALRFTIAGGIMLTGMLLLRKLRLGDIRLLAGRSLILSIFMTIGTFGCMFVAQTRVDSGFMARLDATGPLVTALFAALILGKKLTKAHITALFVGTAGSFLIASPAVNSDPLYVAFAAASVIFYAAGNALYPRLFHQDEDPILISALQSFLGGVVLMLFAFSVEAIHFPKAAIGPLIYLTLGGSVIGHTATLIIVRDAGPVFASSWLYVAPVVATISGLLILNEPISMPGIIGTVLALLGVFFLDRAEQHHMICGAE